MLRVGLTGGIATGKSRIRERLASAGCHTLDLDGLAHQAMAPGGAAYADVVDAFGEEILAADGGVDRSALGRIVFADPEARLRLNGIVHPRVRAAEEARVEALAGDPRAVVVSEAALLVETGRHLRFDRLVVASCTPQQQESRLSERDGSTLGAARQRIRSQMPVEDKRGFAHFEIDTSGSIESTDQASEALARSLGELEGSLPEGEPLLIDRAGACLLAGPAEGPGELGPVALLREIVAAGGVELDRLQKVTAPGQPGPWYRAQLIGPGPGAETLMAPLVLWAATRRGADGPFLLAAAASLARLTHGDASAVSDACLYALALQAALSAGELDIDLPGWRSSAQRWGGVAPSERLESVVARGLASGGEGPGVGDDPLVQALRALGGGRVSSGDLPEALRRDLEKLSASARP